MFDDIDRAYFQRRLLEEKQRAALSRDMTSARIHEGLAQEYERRIASIISRPMAAN